MISFLLYPSAHSSSSSHTLLGSPRDTEGIRSFLKGHLSLVFFGPILYLKKKIKKPMVSREAALEVPLILAQRSLLRASSGSAPPAALESRAAARLEFPKVRPFGPFDGSRPTCTRRF